MDAKNLRLGNFVSIENPEFLPEMKGVPLAVSGINMTGGNKWSIQLEHIKKIANYYYESYSQFENYVQPIPISEKILAELGFEQTEKFGGNGFLYSNFILFKVKNNARSEDWFYECEFAPSGFAFSERSHIMSNIRHLHEIQNLYFSLTKMELTF